MRNLIFVILLTLPSLLYSQNWVDDSSLDEILNTKSAFGDDESKIVVIEFWAKFNEANAFPDWDKVKGADYYRVDIGKAPIAKKEYRVRMAPTIIIFKNGVKEETFKAGLDLECPVNLQELKEAIEEVKTAGAF